MFGVREVIAAVLLVVAVGAYAQVTCPHADKIRPVNVDFSEIARKRMKVLYGTENDFSLTLDHAYIDITPIGNDTYRAVSTTTTKGNVTKSKTYTFLFRDGIMYQTLSNAHAGEKTARTYILAHAPKENAILYYRCKTGGSNVDLRFILLPDGNTLSEESLNQLLEVDRSFNFNGKLFRLPYQH